MEVSDPTLCHSWQIYQNMDFSGTVLIDLLTLKLHFYVVSRHEKQENIEQHNWTCFLSPISFKYRNYHTVPQYIVFQSDCCHVGILNINKCVLSLRVLKLLPTSSEQQPYHHNILEVNQGVRAVLLLVFAHCLLLSLVTLVPNSRDRHEKMATKFYAPQNMP